MSWREWGGALPEEGLEPSPCCQDGILNPARLPIPPLRLVRRAPGPVSGRPRDSVGGDGWTLGLDGVPQPPIV